uniref:C3H1-type domain-containing protein n=1 Tax=Globisporangium ultimum (strain ATCC 200006 / CBS 805.95 / DAOM BR144) TaxID=431595 RepID=K3X220_GLOUD
METGDSFGAFASEELRSQVPADVRLLIQELQSSRQKEKELQLQVESLQTEQKLAKQRLALYSLYALKLKRELINERLAHIDSKKEVEELRLTKQPAHQGDSGDERESTAVRGGGRRLSVSQEAANRNSNPEEDEDPWSSPGKARSGGNAGSGHLLSFSSFYSSRHNEGGAGSEDSPPSPMSSMSSGINPLRSSLMGQFLPSTLLDSPQITPSSRSSTSSKSAFRKEDRLTFDAEIKEAMQPFSLSEPPCTQCKQNPVTECMPCGHKLCANHESNMLTRNELICPRCSAKVSSIKEIRRQEDNQVDHLLEGDVLEEKPPSGTNLSSPGGRGSTSSVVSPITLSVMSELFESIPVDQLEAVLKESSGQPSLAMESLLHNHPSFNPGTSTLESSPIAPGHKAALHRANSGTSSNQGGGTGVAGPSGGATSNWKTEMCMYYLQGKCNKTRRTCSFAHGESDLVRSNTSKHTSSAGYKSRLCPLYLEGICPKSRRDCPLAHGENDLRDGLAVLTPNTVLPPAAPRLQSYKTELCYYYLKGCCNYTKEECRFAHGESDLRTVESNTMEWTAKLSAGGGVG